MSIGIILMSRAPIPGKTKTRLETDLTAKECAKLHQAFLEDISRMLMQLGKNRADINLYLSYTPVGTEEMFNAIVAKEFKTFAQQGKDLGQRMYNASAYVAQENDYQIILGSDLPTLQPSIILSAIKKLAKNDLVIGPSQDGGYYLLASKEARPFLFDNIIFGKNDVLKATIKAIKAHDLSYGLVKTWSDIDLYPELLDLHRELEHKNQWEIYPRATAKIVGGILRKLRAKGEENYEKQAK